MSSRTESRFGYVVLLIITSILAASCTKPDPMIVPVVVGQKNTVALRVYSNPYSDVEWNTDLLLKAQHHDHIGNSPDYLSSYDKAGYDVMSLMTYSGVASKTFSWHERRWPAEKWLPATFLSQLKSIKFFIPNGEEIGGMHMTSSFMTTYIAAWEPAFYAERAPWHYNAAQELIDVIGRNGGAAIIAHPWEDFSFYESLDGYSGMEIYSAYVSAQLARGDNWFFQVDRNPDMLANWDRALVRNQRILGIAVNDHYGPYSPVAANIRDSGKVLVWSHAATLDAYRNAFSRGSLVAVRDMGQTKDRYPRISRIVVSPVEIALEGNWDASVTIRWIANGVEVGSTRTLLLDRLSKDARYVRAEITNSEGSTVYTQAFSVRPVGDTNGDGAVNQLDQDVCTAVSLGTDKDRDHAEACQAIQNGS